MLLCVAFVVVAAPAAADEKKREFVAN